MFNDLTMCEHTYVVYLSRHHIQVLTAKEIHPCWACSTMLTEQWTGCFNCPSDEEELKCLSSHWGDAIVAIVRWSWCDGTFLVVTTAATLSDWCMRLSLSRIGLNKVRSDEGRGGFPNCMLSILVPLKTLVKVSLPPPVYSVEKSWRIWLKKQKQVCVPLGFCAMRNLHFRRHGRCSWTSRCTPWSFWLPFPVQEP